MRHAQSLLESPPPENSADLLTKALERAVFEKHRDTIMNIASCAECSVVTAPFVTEGGVERYQQ